VGLASCLLPFSYLLFFCFIFFLLLLLPPPPSTSPTTTAEPVIPSGLLAVYKPRGFTSSDAVAKVRSVLQRHMREAVGRRVKVKVGHGGTLDPLATGVLVLGVGGGCKQLTDYLSGSKRYRALGRLGAETETLDTEGKVVEECPADHVTPEALLGALPDFRGDIEQVPPMFSALHKDGKRLYELARQGITVERESRPVTIHHLDLLQGPTEWAAALPTAAGTARVGHGLGDDDICAPVPFSDPGAALALPDFALDVECSGGTYIRSLISDLARHHSVQSCAHMTLLERTKQGPFTLDHCLPLSQWTFDGICTHVEWCNTNVLAHASNEQ